ncbi:MAG: inverse autotransporter beta domain-containing protein, partial [Legionellales bacterium]|nr:inverse autotransporter beta domain-containing protein [Legionellales bacterium]
MQTPRNILALNSSIILFLIFKFCTVHADPSANTETSNRFVSQVELTAKKGITGKKKHKRDIGRLGFVMPFFQNSRSVAFVTMIGMGDTNKAIEGNFGAGYRVLNTKSSIIGGYLFYDLRSTPN